MLVPRRRDRIADKYPGKLGEHFATIPHKLLDPNNSLGLDRNELVVIIVLERFRWRHDDLVFPSQELIARMTRLRRRTVQRVLDGLISDGLILKENLQALRDAVGYLAKRIKGVASLGQRGIEAVPCTS